MKYLSIILLIGFVSLAVFGVFGMHIGTQSHNGGCLTAAISGVNCPKQASIIGYLSFHLDALKVFSTAIFTDHLLTLFFVLTLLVLSAGLGMFFGNLLSPYFNFARARLKENELFNSIFKQKFNYWLALHENSPSLA